MCQYSLEHLASRPAAVGDKLTLFAASTGSRGFCDAADNDQSTAICLRPGTELAFDESIRTRENRNWYGPETPVHTEYKTAIYRYLERNCALAHRDAVETPDGTQILLMDLYIGQHATVLQLPVEEKVEEKAEANVGPINSGLVHATKEVVRELERLL